MSPVASDVQDDSHSWAVSYADFLMVLLSFFVIFFSTDNKKRDVIIDIVAQQNANKASASETAGSSGGLANQDLQISKSKEFGEAEQKSLQKLIEEFPGFEFYKEDGQRRLVLNFPPDIYALGQYDLSPDLQKVFDKVISQVKEHEELLDIMFVGHTDSRKVSKKKHRDVASNFDLSSIRASRALEHARHLGFDEAHMTAKGEAEFSRNSRTLSIVIIPRGGER